MKPGARVLILGGGISGLLAAWHLRRRGLCPEVWEAAEAPGGWAQTLPWPGPAGEPGALERGPQLLRLRRGDALDRLRAALGLPWHPSGPRGPRWVVRGGQRLPSPATLAGLLAAPGLGLAGRLRLLAEPFVAPGTDEAESLHAFFARRLGEGFARECLPALVAGVLAAPPERLGLAALPRLRRLEARGGLLQGSLREGPQASGLPGRSVGELARALATALPPGTLLTGRAARALESAAGGGWRVLAGAGVVEVDAVVLALPAPACAPLLQAAAPAAAAGMAALPRLDLRIWHSRHRPVPGWERGIGLLFHPPEGRGLLGAVSLAATDPRGVPGLLQLRTYLGGAWPVAPDLAAWPGIFRELRRGLPELGEAIQVREEVAPGAFPLLGPDHPVRMRAILASLPLDLHWVGADRFGPGIPDLAEGLAAWAQAATSG